MSISFVRRVLMLVASFVLVLAGSLAIAPAAHAAPSLICPTLNASVAYGGSVSIDVSNCDGAFNFGVGGPDTLPVHGTAVLGQQSGPGIQFATYAHNGVSGTTDSFTLNDENGDVITVNITILPPTSSLVVAPGSLPTLVAGTALSQTITTTGGAAPYSYAIDSGVLPVGVSLSSSGLLSGTPTHRGVYNFSVRVADSASATTVKGYSGSVQNPSLSLAANTGTASPGVPFSQTLITNGGVAPHSYLLETGSLPAGITLSSSGVISGTTNAALGSYPITMRVTDASTPTNGAYFELETFTLTIANQPNVSIAVSPASVSEDGATNLTYTVTRSAVSASPLTVNLTASGTAAAGTDYTGNVASVTIAANATTATVAINPNVDATVEANETVTLTVATGTGYTVGAPSSATGTILNDDVPTASIAVSPASVSEDGATNLVYTVTLNQASLSATSVNFTVSGTATSGTDFAVVNSPLVIAAGATSATITVNPTVDATIESNETVILTVAAGAGYTVGSPAAATGTITNDDVSGGTSTLCPTINVNVANGGSVAFEVSNCDGPFDGGVSGPFVLPTHGTVVIGPNSNNVQFVTYSHNGNAATTDRFELEDNALGTIVVNVTIAAPTSSIVVSPAALPALQAGTAFSQTLSATGGTAPYSFTLESGALPPGLTLTSGSVTGTPTRRGGYAFSVIAEDALGATISKSYSGTVQNPSLALAVNTGTANQGSAYSQALVTNGGVGPYTYQLETGSFPAGISISSTGVISGTTAATPGAYAVTLRVTDSSTGPGSYFELETFTLTVAALPTVSIAVSPASVSEDGATNLTYTVTRSAVSASPLTVNLTTTGSATAGTDYTGNVASVTIAANATTATVAINPTADNVIESNETVILTVAAGTGYTVGSPASATGTITNDDVSAGTSTLCPNLYATVAYGGSVSIDATACHVGFGLGNIATQATHGTGSVGPFGPSQFINYAHNGTSGTTDTFIVRDGNSPPNNLIQVNITITPPTSSIVVAPANLPTLTAGTAFSQTLTSTGGTGPYTYSMSSGALPTGLSLSPAGVLSGTPTQRGTYTFSVQSQDSLGATSVKGYTGTVQNPSLALALNTGTANQGSAYSQTLITNGGVGPYTYQLETGSFPAGITISSAGVISGTTAATPGPYAVTLRVTDSSTGPGSYFELEAFTLEVVALPTVSIAVTPASVSEDGATNLTYTVTRSAVSASPLTVNLTISGTATSSTDYTGSAATVTIAANATTATLVIDPTVDANVEADETVILTVAAGTGYTAGAPASATGTILNDDVPSASIAVSPASVSEDGAPNLVYTVTLSQASLTATDVNFAFSGTTTNGTDFAAVANPLVIAAGATSGTITINPIADATIELDETVIVTLVAGSGYVVGAPAAATGTILNDDLPNLTINDVVVNEGDAGTTTASFTVSLSAPAGPGGVTFDIATANNTATAGVDYVARSLVAQIIPAGASTYTFDVLINGDLLNEPLERFFVNVTNVSGASVVDPQGRGTIQNDDALPTLSINDVTLVEGNSGFTRAVFTVTLNAASAQNVTVIYASSNGTATAGIDYGSVSGTLTFAPGELTQTISPAVLGDTEVEADETFVINLSGAINATIADGAGQGTIQNDDATPVLASIAPASGPASGGTSVTLTGSELTDATGVRFGATLARSFTVNSATSITATAPAGSGVVDVTVTTPSGTTATTAATRFTFIDAPVASGVNLTALYNDGTGTAASLDLSTRVTGDVTSYAVGTATHGTVSATGSQVLYVPNVGYAGSDSFTFTATGPGGTSSPATVNVNVTLASLTLTPGTLANGQRGQAYSETLVAGGGVGPYTYVVTGGALPTGLTLTSGGILSGTPQASGAFNFTVTATDSSTGAGPFSVVRGYGLNIGAPTIALTPTAGALPGATVGVAYSGAVSANGGIAPYSFAVTGGALPAGLTLASNGSLTGTPTTSGTFTFTVTATDAATAGSGGPYTGSAVYSLSVGDSAPVADATNVTVVYGAGATPVAPVLSGGPTTSVAVATAPSRARPRPPARR